MSVSKHKDDGYDGDLSVLDGVPNLKPKPVRVLLAAQHLHDALPRRTLRQLAAGRACVVLVETPTEAWSTALAEAAEALHPKARVIKGERRKAAEISTVPASGPTFAIAESRQTLPPAVIAGADVAVRIWPNPASVMRTLREVYGRSAHVKPADLSGLNLPDIEFSFRPTGTAAEAVARMRRASRSRSTVEAYVKTPKLDDLLGFGDALDIVRDIAREVSEACGRDNLKPPSFLLYGRPGFGKTLLARAFAQSVSLPFIATSVGDWFRGEGHLGDVIKSARSAFDQALASAPAILFVDEIDGIPSREGMDSRGKDWWTPVVTSILLNIDRTREAGTGVILIGATNHLDHLDRALVRPGRFDRLIEIRGPQTVGEVAGIFRSCLGDDLAGVDLCGLARLTAEPSGASIVDWVAQARAAAKSDGRALSLSDLVNAVAPPETRDPAELRGTALHECAHAVVGAALGVEVRAVSIVKIAEATGVTTIAPPPIVSREQLEAHTVTMLAGRAADVHFGGVATSGAAADLDAATRYLCLLHGTLGLGDSLVVRAKFDEPTTALAFDLEFRMLIDRELKRLMTLALAMVHARRTVIVSLADRLLLTRVLTGSDVAEAMKNGPPDANAKGDRRPPGQ